MENGKKSPSYYDILNVPKDCSQKDIRNAYLKLSKKFHPDVKGMKSNSKDAKQFLKISEAYNTLSRPSLRKDYDRRYEMSHSTNYYNTDATSDSHVFRPWEMRGTQYQYNTHSNAKRANVISNFKLAMILVIISVIAGVSGASAARYINSYTKRRSENISAKATEHHTKVVNEANSNSKEEQLRLLVERMQQDNSKK